MTAYGQQSRIAPSLAVTVAREKRRKVLEAVRRASQNNLQKLLQKAAFICYTDRTVRIATVTSQRQITLLQGELEAVGVVPGDEFIVAVENGVIVLTPKPANRPSAHTTR